MKKIISLLILVFTMCITGCGLLELDVFSHLSANVDDDAFTYKNYSYGYVETTSIFTNKVSMKYFLEVNVECIYNIYQTTASVNVFDESDFSIAVLEKTYSKSVDKNNLYTISISITEEVYNNIDRIEVSFSGKAYTSKNPELLPVYEVTFVYNNTQENNIVEVTHGEKLSKPFDPVYGELEFLGWYTSSTFTSEYNFDLEVTSNFTLYANYLTDEDVYLSIVQESILSANITVYTESYNKSGFFVTEAVASSGSGVIFLETSSYYYALTNNHVIHKATGYSYVEYIVYDYNLNSYSDTEIVYNEADYDLAVVKFKKENKYKENLIVAKLADSNAVVNSDIIAIGQPKGVTNTITFGTISKYTTPPTITNASADESNVKFNVMQHNAYTNSGSSGGGVFNSNYELIGIAYACSTYSNGDFYASQAVPIEKVHEFLNDNVWVLIL